jgi:antitoxin ParD1/3/4
MNVSLTPELEQMVNDRVRSGLYQTASEVVREALRLLKQRDEDRETLRADVRAGLAEIEQGRPRPLTAASSAALGSKIKKRGRGVPRRATSMAV